MAGDVSYNFRILLQARTIVNKKTGEYKQLEVYRMYRPGLPELAQLENLWNRAWKYGIDDSNPCAPLMKEVLLVSPEQIRAMHDNSWSNILVAMVDGKIEAAIWGNQLDLERGPEDIERIKNYDLVTGNKTFENCHPTGNSRLCVSVVNNPDFNGFKTEKEKISIGQFLVLCSLIEVVRHPYQTDVYAYSRPSSLSRFVEIVRGVERQFGWKIRFDQNFKKFKAIKGNERADVQFETERVRIGSTYYDFKDIREVSILPTRNGYYLEPAGEKLFTDEKGVFISDGDKKDYIVEIDPYLKHTNFDQMAKFHGGRGGEVFFILPRSRVNPQNHEIGDPISLSYNIVFHFPIGRIISANKLSRQIYDYFTPEQKFVMKKAAVSPRVIRHRVDRLRHDKDIYFNAFSREKMWSLLKYAELNRAELLYGI